MNLHRNCVAVRKGKIETIEQNKDKGMGVTVYIGQKRGNASTSDFSAAALRATVDAAYNIARFTAEDDCADRERAIAVARPFDEERPVEPVRLADPADRDRVRRVHCN